MLINVCKHTIRMSSKNSFVNGYPGDQKIPLGIYLLSETLDIISGAGKSS